MSKQKLTPWFRNGEKPARKGVYQQMSGTGDRLGYQRWDGKRWMVWCETAEAAAGKHIPVRHSSQGDPWRGLAEKP